MALNNNYVKFRHGSLAAYEALATKNEDTLYFIKISEDETRLYWGDRLISDGNEMPTEIVTALKDLTDVNISEDIILTDGMFLGYNTETGKWEPKTQTEVTVEDMVGATSETAGSAGLVPAPAAGDEKKVLTGDGNWTELNIPDTSELEAKMTTLIGADNDKSVRTIATEEVTKIVTGADESYDTLKEISDWIKQHPEDVAEINSKIADIEKELFDEVTGEDGVVIKNSKIASLQEEFETNQEAVGVISNEIGTLEELLGAKKDESGNLTGLSKIETIESILGIDENEEGEIIITSAPIGNLEDLLLYKNAEENDKLGSLVDAINILTENMTWKSL